jgi:hypothetical protein
MNVKPYITPPKSIVPFQNVGGVKVKGVFVVPTRFGDGFFAKEVVTRSVGLNLAAIIGSPWFDLGAIGLSPEQLKKIIAVPMSKNIRFERFIVSSLTVHLTVYRVHLIKDLSLTESQ